MFCEVTNISTMLSSLFTRGKMSVLEKLDHVDIVEDDPPEQAEPFEEIEEMKEIVAEVEKNQSLSELFRKELEGYLDELDHKTTSEGESLIEIPENFDNIVQAMTREDLLENTTKPGGEKPWYDYIIRDHVNKKLEKDFKGRYHNVIEGSEDEHIRKGMAEILMLDRQLWLLSKKAQLLAEDPDNPKHVPGSVPVTPASRKHDRTFITKLGSSPPKSSSNRHTTGRPGSGYTSSRHTTPRHPEEDDGEDRDTTILENEENEDEGGESVESMQKALTTAKMTEHEQAKRLAELLSADDDQLNQPYISPEYEIKSKEIDNKLEEFGHLDRLQSTKEIEEELRYIDGKDYLTQQRLERKRNQHAAKIDQLLACNGNLLDSDLSFFNQSDAMSGASSITHRSHILDADVASLLAMAKQDDLQSRNGGISSQTEISRATSRSSFNPRLHEVPQSIDEIRPDVLITREDINTLIHNLQEEYRTTKRRNNNNYCGDENEDNIMAMSAKTSPRSSRPTTSDMQDRVGFDTTESHRNASFDDIDDIEEGFSVDEHTKQRIHDLLQEYAEDVQRMSRLRASSRISARLFAGESLVSPITSRPSSSRSTSSDASVASNNSRAAMHRRNVNNISKTIQQQKANNAVIAMPSSSTIEDGKNKKSAGKNEGKDKSNNQAPPKSSSKPKSQLKQPQSTINNHPSSTSSKNNSKKSNKKNGSMLFAQDDADSFLGRSDIDFQSLQVLQPTDCITSEFAPSHQLTHRSRVQHADFEEEYEKPVFSRSDLRLHPDFVDTESIKISPPKHNPQEQRTTSQQIKDMKLEVKQERAPEKWQQPSAVEEQAEADRELLALLDRQRQRQQEIALLQAERERIWQSLIQQSDRLEHLQHHSATQDNDDMDDDDAHISGFNATTTADIDAAAKAATTAAMARLLHAERDDAEYPVHDQEGNDFEIENDSDDNDNDNEDNRPHLKLPRIPSAAHSVRNSVNVEGASDPTEEKDDDYFYQLALKRLDIETQRAIQRSMQPLANNPRVKKQLVSAAATNKLIASPPPTSPQSAANGRRHLISNNNGNNNNSNTSGEGNSSSTVAIMRETLLNQVREYVEI